MNSDIKENKKGISDSVYSNFRKTIYIFLTEKKLISF